MKKTIEYELVPNYGSIFSEEDTKVESDTAVSKEDVTLIEPRCTILEATANLVKVITGSGMLSLPFAALSMGWSAIVVLLLLGLMFLYAFHLLAVSVENYTVQYPHVVRSKNKVTAVDYVTFGRLTFGKYGDKVVLSIFGTELLLAVVSLYMNIAINLQVLNSKIPFEVGVCFASILTLALLQLDLKLSAYSSALGSFMTLFTVVALLVSGLELDPNSSIASSRHHDIFKPSGLPLSIGLVAFCFGGHAAFPKIYQSIEDKTRYREVLIYTFICVFSIYGLVMSIGYSFFAQYVHAPVTMNIGRELDLSNLKNAVMLRVLAALGVICNLQVTCPLLAQPIRDNVIKMTSLQSNQFYQFLVSCFLVSIAASLAIYLKGHFAVTCSLIGSVASFTDSIILPILFYHKVFKDDATIFTILLHTGIMLTALICFGAGVWNTVCELSPGLPVCNISF